MRLIINTSSMVPIYEQIVESIRRMIASGELQGGEALPSVRTVANDLKISALTVKKAYDHLEEEGLTRTVHGKGTFVTRVNPALVAEQHRQEIETDMDHLLTKAKLYGMEKEEILEILELIWEE